MIDIQNIPDTIRPHIIYRRYRQNEYILKEGDTTDKLYIIVNGSCIIQLSGISGDMFYIDIFNPGDYFGELEIFSDKIYTAEVKALTACEIIEIHKNYVLEWMKTDFSFNMQLVEALAKRIHKYSSQIRTSQVYTVKQRVAQIIIEYNKWEKGTAVTRKDLIYKTKASERSVSRALTELIKDRAVKKLNSHSVVINDENILYRKSGLDQIVY